MAEGPGTLLEEVISKEKIKSAHNEKKPAQSIGKNHLISKITKTFGSMM